MVLLLRRGVSKLLLCVWSALLLGPGVCAATDSPPASFGAFSNFMLERARNEVARVQALVEDGTLPKSRLEEAKLRLADAEDDAVLARTLYGQQRLADMTVDDARAMLDAAKRRVDRQAQIVKQRQTLLDTGIIAKSEFAAFQEELDSRERVLELAQDRAKLLDDLKQMAAEEQRLVRTAEMDAAALKNVMIRYDGTGEFDLEQLPDISIHFEKHFHHALPISAIGQTAVHQSMGLDHRNRVDVALNPDQPEGVWLRQYLESLGVPYLAFRSALAGAATAPHIHIGTGSSRLKRASR